MKGISTAECGVGVGVGVGALGAVGVDPFEDGPESPVFVHAASTVTPTANATHINTRMTTPQGRGVRRRSLRPLYRERERDGSVEHLRGIPLAVETDHHGVE